jgi:hypothetical protein
VGTTKIHTNILVLSFQGVRKQLAFGPQEVPQCSVIVLPILPKCLRKRKDALSESFVSIFILKT